MTDSPAFEEIKREITDNDVLLFIQRLFPPFEVRSNGVFRILRDSEMEIDEESISVGKHGSPRKTIRKTTNSISLLLSMQSSVQLLAEQNPEAEKLL